MRKMVILGLLFITSLPAARGKRKIEVETADGKLVTVQLARGFYESRLQEVLIECRNTCQTFDNKYIGVYGPILLDHIFKNASLKGYIGDKMLQDYDSFTEFVSEITRKISPGLYQNTTLPEELDEINESFNMLMNHKARRK